MQFEDFVCHARSRQRATARDPDEWMHFHVINNPKLGRYEFWLGNKVWVVKPIQVDNAATVGRLDEFIDIKLKTMRGKGLFQPNPYLFRVQDLYDVCLGLLRDHCPPELFTEAESALKTASAGRKLPDTCRLSFLLNHFLTAIQEKMTPKPTPRTKKNE